MELAIAEHSGWLQRSLRDEEIAQAIEWTSLETAPVPGWSTRTLNVRATQTGSGTHQRPRTRFVELRGVERSIRFNTKEWARVTRLAEPRDAPAGPFRRPFRSLR